MHDSQSGAVRKTPFARVRNRLFHLWFLLRRPMTLGVRAIVLDAGANAVMLVRHTYVPGWQLPGGGVETGETLLEALTHELAEEANIVARSEPKLVSVHFNRNVSRRDHVALFLVTEFDHTGPRAPDREIAEARFFPLDALPPDLAPGARSRLNEALHGAARSSYW